MSDSEPIPAAMGAATNASNRRVDLEITGLCHPAGEKAKVPLVTANSAECEVPLESQTNSFSSTRVSRDRLNTVPSMKRIPMLPVGCGLDHVALANRIASHDLNGNAVRTPEGAATYRGLNIADDLGKQGRNGLTVVPGLDAERNEHGFDLAC